MVRNLSAFRPPEPVPPVALPAASDEDMALGYLVLTDRLVFSLSGSQGVLRREVDFPFSNLGGLSYRYRNAVLSGFMEAQELGGELFDAVMAPVWDTLRHARHVTISTEGALRYVPFSAFFVDGGYLVERMSISHWSGAPAGTRTATPPRSWRVVGAGTASLDHVRRELDGLPSGVGKTVFFGTDFTAAALSRALSGGAEVVHLASHFDLDPVQAGLSSLRLGDGGALSLDMLRQGTDYDFSGVELLYLSGCDTATATQGLETLESLAGVFHIQGVCDVVATLWPVLDEDAATMATGFYNAVVGCEADASPHPRAQALTLSQLDMLRGSRLRQGDCGQARGGLRVEVADATHPQHWASHVIFTS